LRHAHEQIFEVPGVFIVAKVAVNHSLPLGAYPEFRRWFDAEKRRNGVLAS